jgi:hypothetical protein
MNRHSITPCDALALLDRLVKDQVPVRALYVSPSNAQFVISGFVQTLDDENGIVISAQQPPNRLSGYLSIPFVQPECECTCGAGGDLLPENDGSLVGKDTSTLTVHFPASGEFLLLLFNPTCALASLFPLFFASSASTNQARSHAAN